MQLDEFARSVKSSYTICSSADDAKHRHRDFITAIENQTSHVENSLKNHQSHMAGAIDMGAMKWTAQLAFFVPFRTFAIFRK